MERLLVRRRALKNRISRVQLAVDSHTTEPLNVTDINIQLGHVAKIRQECVDLEVEMEEACTEEESAGLLADFNAMNSLLDKLNSKLFTLLPTNWTPPAAPPPPKVDQVKLPRIDLPSFSGNIQEWMSFQDLFVATVHKNSSLSGAQKLQYLKLALKDEASSLIQSIQITDANYDEAWSILLKRYENKREIIKSHLKRLFSQQTITVDSPANLRQLLDVTTECVRSLKVLECPTDQWNHILEHVISEKLDPESRRQWELSLEGDGSPSFDNLCDFLNKRSRALAAADCVKDKVSSKTSDSEKGKKQKTSVNLNSKIQCVICHKDHYVNQCDKFKKLSVVDRWNSAQKHGLCFNCLGSGHNVKDCSRGSCKTCQQKHHTLLHKEKSQQRAKTPPPAIQGPSVDAHFSSDQTRPTEVLLMTALVEVRSSRGEKMILRALLDSGAQSSFITANFVRKLGLKCQRTQIPISGLGQVGVGTASKFVSLRVSSRHQPFAMDLEALVMPTLTGFQPHSTFDISSWTHIKGIQLADPNFAKPGVIDILLGADVFGEAIIEGVMRGPSGSAKAINTVFGWVLSGRVDTAPTRTVDVHHVQCDLDNTLKKFWEIEEMPKACLLTPEEKSCEEHFAATHTRDPNGRYVVQLPFKENSPNLGKSRDQAIQRFKQVERRLERNPLHQEEYIKFMNEYLELGHMEEITQDPKIDPQPASNSHLENLSNVKSTFTSTERYYIPHHFVLKPSSTTTKLRVVFDASAKTTSGVSLNQKLMVGPKLQDDLVPILLRFRTHAIALSADIAKMYRQIQVDPTQTDFQRIVWRESPDKPMREFRLKTVTYGTASAPYQATKCLQQLAHDEQNDFPIAAPIALTDFFVDDLLSGSKGRESALVLQKDLIGLMGRGGFQLRKWSSNDPTLLESLPPEYRETQVPLTFDKDESIKTLGVRWNPATDHFSFAVTPPKIQTLTTKRSLLSDLAKTFDPLGWLSPITIKAKILFQSLWILPLTWDDPLPEDITKEWSQYCSELELISQIQIPRCIIPSGASEHHLHGFSDASKQAYSAVVYVRSIFPDGHVEVNLVMAKTKVAPLKQITVPRLELCGAVLLVNVLDIVQKACKVDFQSVHAWTDSTIVLDWISAYPHRWKTFVANRVAQIQEMFPSKHWHHVPGEENPADCASRGISPAELLLHPLWWKGPPWLCETDIRHKFTVPEHCETAEESAAKVAVHTALPIVPIMERYSTLNKLKRMTAYQLRFISNIRSKPRARKSGLLTSEELKEALNRLVNLVQSASFPDELKALQKNRELPLKSKLLCLDPFLDENGLIRVGGRLKSASIPNDRKHPVILPRKGTLTDLIIRHYHHENLHAGQQLVLASIRQEFWILCARDAVRRVLHQCVTCFRHRPKLASQVMGDLPATRINAAPAFLKTGVDFAGPLTLRVLKGRGQKRYKAYISLFICLVTKAIHLELVTDLTSEAFLAALKRFIARRGKPTDLFSDCGTNFVGANRELKEIYDLLSSSKNQVIVNYLTSQNVNWHFNPPSSPHFGGLWEAGVKSVKNHLNRVIGNADLNYEEMLTTLTQIEACVNSRPLTPLSSDPNDLTALTPGHFLIGRPLNAIPEPDLTDLKINRLSRWQLTQQLSQHFWRRWSNEYIAQLQPKNKWQVAKANLKINELVLVKDDNLPSQKWRLGRIIDLHPGKDNHVRVVTVKTSDGVFKRPIVKLSPLPTNE